MTIPSADVSILHRADGSARYSAAGYTVVAAVNGPIEVQRRDELPQHTALEVNVRPAVGVGSEYQPVPDLYISDLTWHSQVLKNVISNRSFTRHYATLS